MDEAKAYLCDCKSRTSQNNRVWSIRRLHLATGVAYSTVFRYWHSYVMRPDPTVLKKLAEVLKVADWRTLIVDEE
jgi:hypothetical protein